MTVLEAFNEMGLPHSNYVLSAFGHHICMRYALARKIKKQYEPSVGWVEVWDYENSTRLKMIIESILKHDKVDRFAPRPQSSRYIHEENLLSPMTQQEIDQHVKKYLGRKVVIIGDHPRADEVGIIIKFESCVGITGKPGFEVEPVDSLLGNFYVFNGKNIKFLN